MTEIVLLATLLNAQIIHDPENDTNVVCKSACQGKGEKCFQQCVMCAIGSGERHSNCLEACHENHVWGTTESANCMARCFNRFETRILACMKEGARPGGG